ncbi:MAG: hypothetical protein J6S23_04955 [Clostridia bacterium]|nr:hypothetical protein [Clostridia bacterium]
MNFKKILVLVMALVMTVSAFAPSIQAFNKDDAKAELDRVAGDVKLVLDQIVDYVSENYEEAYAEGYAYALENGYIGATVEALDTAISAIEGLDVSSLDVDADMEAALEAELDACLDTLREVKAVLENGSADNFEGLVVALVGLENDLYTHLDNLRAICAEVEVDLSVFDYALAVLDEALTALEMTINGTIEAAKDYLAEALAPYYEYVCEKVEIALDVYNAIVETVVDIHTTILRIHAKLLEVNEAILDTIAAIENAVEKAIDTYVLVVETLVKVCESIGAAIPVAIQMYREVVAFVLEYQDDAENAVVAAKELYSDLVDIVEAALVEGKKAQAVALEVYAHVVALLGEINAEIRELLYNTLNAHYELNEDSYYVALGKSGYASELAALLHLDNKYDIFGLNGNYANALAGADLVTLDLTDDGIYDFAKAQVMGKLAGSVRSNSTLMSWYNDKFIVGPAIRQALDELGIDINANAQDLDWSKYLDEEGSAALDACLADLKLQIVEAGVPEVYVLPLGDIALEILEQNGVSFPGLTINVFVDVPVADLVVFLVENLLYKHAELTHNLVSTLENVYATAPEATVVITGLETIVSLADTELAGLGLDLAKADEAVAAVTDVLNLQLFAFALANENTIFVDSVEAEDIFVALNFTCAHVYDDYCLDATCNLCEEERVAPGHTFENYESNGDATCTKNGTETAKCENCDVTDTREDDNSKTAHDYADATCKTPKTCKDCGAKQGSVAAHTYGEWVVTIKATTETTGVQVKTCANCGHKVEEEIPMIIDNSPKVIATIGIVILVAAVVCGAAVGAYSLIKKRKNA